MCYRPNNQIPGRRSAPRSLGVLPRTPRVSHEVRSVLEHPLGLLSRLGLPLAPYFLKLCLGDCLRLQPPVNRLPLLLRDWLAFLREWVFLGRCQHEIARDLYRLLARYSPLASVEAPSMLTELEFNEH